LSNPLTNQYIFDHSYYVFFSGINYYKSNIKRYSKDDKTGFLEKTLNKFVDELEKIRDNHKLGIKKIPGYYTHGKFGDPDWKQQTLWLSFNYKPFSGHQSILAHYYRHLFQTVKFVANQNEIVISYNSKRDYLRVLRSMLSNHEQILLYYNWLAGFGNNWELKIDDINYETTNKFFTDYRMIHNIPNQMIFEEFKLEKIFVKEYLNFRYEKGRKKQDTLFELLPIVSKA